MNDQWTSVESRNIVESEIPKSKKEYLWTFKLGESRNTRVNCKRNVESAQISSDVQGSFPVRTESDGIQDGLRNPLSGLRSRLLLKLGLCYSWERGDVFINDPTANGVVIQWNIWSWAQIMKPYITIIFPQFPLNSSGILHSTKTSDHHCRNAH